MKATSKKSKSSKASSATTHRRHLEKMLKQILAGNISLSLFQQEMTQASFPRFSYRRVIE